MFSYLKRVWKQVVLEMRVERALRRMGYAYKKTSHGTYAPTRYEILGDLPCWLDEHGWGDAGYMDDPDEQASECALLRERSVAGVSDAIPYCRRHGFHEETARRAHEEELAGIQSLEGRI